MVTMDRAEFKIDHPLQPETGFSFILFPNKHNFFNLRYILLTLLLPFLSDLLDDIEKIRPFTLKGHRSNC